MATGRIETVSLPGLSKVYHSLHAHQLALYHGVPLEVAQAIKASGSGTVPNGTPMWRDTMSIGAFRSGKTFAACYKLLRVMMREAGAQAMVVRKRHEQLKNTFLAEFLKVAALATKCDGPRCRSTGNPCNGHSNWLVGEPREDHGSVELEIQTFGGKPSKIIFRIEPDGSDEDVRDSFKGYELAMFVMEEASQLRQITYETLYSRLSWMGGTCGLILSNPVYAGHWLAELRAKCERDAMSWNPGRPDDEKNQKPQALVIRSETQDNVVNLPTNYIADLQKQYRDRPVEFEMYLMGYDGVKVEGRPVFAGQFNRADHIQEVQFNPYRPLIRGWDFGYHNPACVFMQVDDQGCLNVLAEYREKEVYIEHFVDAVKAFTVQNFPLACLPSGPGIEDYGDHAGTQETDKQGTSIQRAFAAGVQIRTKPNDRVENGLNQIRKLMKVKAGPRFRFQIHPRCQELVSALAYGYHYQVYNNGQVAFKPKKDNKWDHIVDAFRYGVIHLFGVDDNEGSGTDRSRKQPRAKIRDNYMERSDRERGGR